MANESNILNLDAYKAPFFKKMAGIKKGEFPRLYKHEIEPNSAQEVPNHIPREQVSLFEKSRNKLAHKRGKDILRPFSSKIDDKQQPTNATGIDEILAIREKLRPWARTDQQKRKTKSNKKTITEKMKEGTLKAWVDHCYDTIHRKDSSKKNQSIDKLLNWDKLHPSVDKIREKEGNVIFEREPELLNESSDDSRTINEETLVLRAKTGGPQPAKETKSRGKNLKNIKHAIAGVNSVLKDYYIGDQKELESLAYNEELYAFRPNQEIVGSWRVDARICDDKRDNVKVQFEGLMVDEDKNYAMLACGVVNREFVPITEFRVEQVTSEKETTARSVFFHQKGTDWLFNSKENKAETETHKPFERNFQQMQRVLSEAAHLILMRKLVIYCNPFRFDDSQKGPTEFAEHEMCPCLALGNECTCGYEEVSNHERSKCFKLKMKSICTGGDICKTNYRFYSPVPIVCNGVRVNVVRVRRRVEMPGDLIQTTNYYMTTVGQIVAVTFVDPYPFETDIWLQIDPKAVLDPHRLVSPERIVPLRERYMCDPQLRLFYENEIERLIAVNKSYLDRDPNLKTGLRTILQDLLNDKPHRVITFLQNFLIDG